MSLHQKVALGPCSIEFHVGTSGEGGQNPAGPSDAPNVPVNVVISPSNNAGKQLNVSTPFQKIVNPA